MNDCLKNYFVLDLSRVLAGPYCTMQLADMGATVVKVENPDGGDETRHWGPPFDEALKLSAYFAAVNRNKKSVAVNLKNPRGRDIVFSLARRADVVVENFLPGGAQKFGLDFAAVAKVNPAVVYCSVTGYGQSGEWQNRAGYDFIIQGESGLMSIGGAPDGCPMKTGVAVCDVIAALNAAQAILAALLRRTKSGRGARIDISLLDCAVAALVNVAQAALSGRQAAKRFGNHHPHIVPYGSFTAADGAFNLAVGNDSQFARLCGIIEQPAWRSRFADNPKRVAGRDELIDKLNKIFKQKPGREWITVFRRHNIPAGKVLNIADTLRLPQMTARQMTTTAGGAILLNTPLTFSDEPKSAVCPPPKLGADTATVLSQMLAFSATQIQQLTDDKIIGGAPPGKESES